MRSVGGREERSLKKALCLLLATIIGAIAGPAYPQTASSAAALAPSEISVIRVGVLVVSPFIMAQNGSLTGFSIELWDAIAKQMKVKTSYQLEPDINGLQDAMQSKTVDLTVVPVFVTSARDQIFDFSYPIMQPGLLIMVRDTGEAATSANPLWDTLRLMFSRTTAEWLGMALLLMLIPAHVVWLLERRHEDGIIRNRSYFPGIFQAIFWAVSALMTQEEGMPRQWLARTLSIFWMFAGVVFVAFYTAQLTTTLTVQQIQGGIQGPSDLPGKPVATLLHSTAADYLQDQNAQVQGFPTADQMFTALLNKKVDAVVFSAPVLLYYASHEGKGLVKTVGPEFNTAPVAFTMQLNSPLRRQIDIAFLQLRENGTYQQIYDKWFGGP